MSYLKSYYLQQMGIETWVRRDLPKPFSPFENTFPSKDQTDVLLVLEGCEWNKAEDWIAGKAGQLLKKMLHSVDSLLERITMIWGFDSTVAEHQDMLLHTHLVRLKPKVIWIMGQLSIQSLRENYAVSVVQSAPLLELLNYPVKKKQVFDDLLKVKQLTQLG